MIARPIKTFLYPVSAVLACLVAILKPRGMAALKAISEALLAGSNIANGDAAEKPPGRERTNRLKSAGFLKYAQNETQDPT